MCGVNHMPDNTCHLRDSPHNGVDFGPAGVGHDDVLASADGLVVDLSASADAGTEVFIVHDTSPLEHDSKGARYRTAYTHLQRAVVKRGDRISRGQVIGEVGLFKNSGLIPHVHWRLWRGDELLDPMSKAVGCYERGKRYSDSTLELTLPLAC
jgi:murein DD-endopeptidase